MNHMCLRIQLFLNMMSVWIAWLYSWRQTLTSSEPTRIAHPPTASYPRRLESSTNLTGATRLPPPEVLRRWTTTVTAHFFPPLSKANRGAFQHSNFCCLQTKVSGALCCRSRNFSRFLSEILRKGHYSRSEILTHLCLLKLFVPLFCTRQEQCLLFQAWLFSRGQFCVFLDWFVLYCNILRVILAFPLLATAILPMQFVPPCLCSSPRMRH